MGAEYVQKNVHDMEAKRPQLAEHGYGQLPTEQESRRPGRMVACTSNANSNQRGSDEADGERMSEDGRVLKREKARGGEEGTRGEGGGEEMTI